MQPIRGHYCYNKNVDELYKVSVTLDWVTESHASAIPEGAENLERYSRTDRYTYILELDGAGKIIGGEWTGSSRSDLPDFLWSPGRLNRSSVPHLDLDAQWC